ncbi:MAG: cytochrome c maturation protein CcmE [Chloroflexi bacterium]|nr:cytochrome c maturation protein CcmE [Chloroflexota bacterium]
MAKASATIEIARRWANPQSAKFVVGGAIILAAFAYLLFTATSSSLVFYHTIDEVIAQGIPVGERIRVAGAIDKDSIEWDAERDTLAFTLFNPDNPSQRIFIIYRGLVPDTFWTSPHVIMEGEYTPGQSFVADAMSVQCPSKYVRAEIQ